MIHMVFIFKYLAAESVHVQPQDDTSLERPQIPVQDNFTPMLDMFDMTGMS
jgi:hypothetical protein